MPFINLLPDELSVIRKMIREKWDKNKAAYNDGSLAADVLIEGVLGGRVLPGAQVRQIREQMGLQVPTLKRGPEPAPPAEELPTDREKKNKLEASKRWREKQTQKETPMRTRLTPGQKDAITKIVQDHTGGENHLTAVELRDLINSKKIAEHQIEVSVINTTRMRLKKSGGISKTKKTWGGGRAVSREPVAAVGGVKEVIERLKAKRDRISAAIETLELEAAGI